MKGKKEYIDQSKRCRATGANGDDRPPNLGPCCGCGTTDDVRCVLLLNGKSPTPGKGWGCAVCNLSSDGAIAVLCGECEGAFAIGQKALAQICTGYPGVDGRTSIHAMRGAHEHNLALHVFADGGFGGEDT